MRPLPSLLSLLAIAPLGVAADLYVETSGADAANDCTTAAAPCATLEHAFSVATAGDAVNIGAGAFSNTATAYPLTTPSGISLLGAGADLTTVNASTANVMVALAPAQIEGLRVGGDAAETALRVDLTGTTATTITGNTFQGSSSGGGLLIHAMDASATGALTVSDNTFSGPGAALGILTAGEGPWDVRVTGNTVSPGSEEGFRLQHTVSSTASSMDLNAPPMVTYTVTGNTLTDVAGTNIRVTPQTSAHITADISDNTITNAGGDGVTVEPGSNVMERLTVSGNTFTVGSGVAVAVQMPDNGVLVGALSGNTIDNFHTGLSVYATSSTSVTDATVDLTIAGNTVANALGSGIDIRMTSSASSNGVSTTIENNTVTDAGGAGLALNVTSANDVTTLVRNNAFTTNRVGVNLECSDGTCFTRLAGNVIQGNTDVGVVASTGYAVDGFMLELRHNTLSGNGTPERGVNFTGDLDIANLDNYDVVALNNWWGTTDRAVIDAHILDGRDSGGHNSVLYTALDDTLVFAPATDRGPTSGGHLLALRAEPDAPPFVLTAGDHPLVVTLGGEPAAPLSLASDGHVLIVRAPAHVAGSVDITVTNPGGQTGTLAGGYTYIDPPAFDDADEDFVLDTADNCPDVSNTDQIDTNADGTGDACSDDDDGDGLTDGVDLCPLVSDPAQTDTDADGIGDACDDDRDGDDVPDLIDNCGVPNTDQADVDGDGVGDACDPAPVATSGACGCTTTSPTPVAPLGLALLALVSLRRRRA